MEKSRNEKNSLCAKMEWLESQLNVVTKQYTDLQEKLAEPDNKNNQTEPDNKTNQTEYHTDEEELAKETEWIREKTIRNYKRKRMDISLTPPQNVETVQNVEHKIKDKKTPLPPPVVVDGIAKFNEEQLFTQFEERLTRLKCQRSYS